MTKIDLLLLAAGACAQTAAPPAFEVASIKPNHVSGYHLFQFNPGGTLHVSNTWIKYAIQQAYDLKDYQVVGAPPWSTSDRFDIEAKAADGEASEERMRVMLQTLLGERCQLKFHRETRELAVLHLVAAKGGPRLRPLKEGEQSQRTRDNSVIGGLRTTADLADWLKNIVGHPVFDRTGITGTYDILVDFDTYEARGQTAPPGYEKPNLTTALAEQLGLRLEAAKDQIPVLVIDSIERPSDN